MKNRKRHHPSNYRNYRANIAAVDINDDVNEDDFARGTDEPLEFANIDGEVRPDEMPHSDSYDNDFYSEAGGLFSGMRKRMQARQAARAKRKQTRANAQTLKAKAKNLSAKAQIEAAKAAQLGVSADTATANALANANQPETTQTTGMSTGVKIGIVVGALAIVGVIIFIVVKRKKK